MRRNFAQVLRYGKIDIKSEYSKLYNLFYEKILGSNSLNDIINEDFVDYYFRGTCLSLDEFNKKHAFHFEKSPEDFNLHYLVFFCEYFYNLLMGLQRVPRFSLSGKNIQTYIEQILRVIEAIGYMQTKEDNLTIFVEKSPAAISVSEIIPQEMSYKMISYNHHSLKGDLEEKKATILQLASLLEAQRKTLHSTNATLENDLFYLFNNFNIRHNNVDPVIKGKYKDYIAKMPKEELEYWYDETYQMCLLAFLEIEHSDRKLKFDDIKDKREASK